MDLFHHSFKSPLRYPGGKSRAVKQVLSHLPKDLTAIASPFLGGGSLELILAGQGVRVHGADGFEPLVNFWTQALTRPVATAAAAEQLGQPCRDLFYEMKLGYDELESDLRKAAAFFMLNRCSFSGMTLSGGFSTEWRHTYGPNIFNRLRRFSAPNLTVELADCFDFIPRHDDKFLYLDPPYAVAEGLYGRDRDMHNGFDHEALAELLNSRDGWIMSYNDCPRIRALYRKHHIVSVQWCRNMAGSHAPSKEALILNP